MIGNLGIGDPHTIIIPEINKISNVPFLNTIRYNVYVQLIGTKFIFVRSTCGSSFLIPRKDNPEVFFSPRLPDTGVKTYRKI